jgi:hypothetical protein
MRNAINSNPVVQVVLVGVLLVVVGFLLMTGVFNREEPAPAPTDGTATTESGAVDSTAAPTAPTDPTATEDPTATAPTPVSETSRFVTGPGLPESVVDAYNRGDTIVLLVTRRPGIEDRRMQETVEGLDGPSLSVFTTVAKHVARYSRVASGVDLDRVPALIVLSPKSDTKGQNPRASVSYGYRGPDSVRQAIRDAGYDGPKLPYHPR